jgi:DNA polymerase
MTYCVQDCSQCEALVENRSQIVNGVGDSNAEIVFVGEAPGQNEDEQGTPFVGSSGDLLTETIQKMGLHRDEVRITNLVRCRPPDNRDPHVDERENCLSHLREELEDIDPQLIVPLGRIPSQTLLGDSSITISDQAGEIHTVDGLPASVLLSVHPAATMYNSNLVDTFEATLQKAANYISGSRLYSIEKIQSKTNKRDYTHEKFKAKTENRTTVLIIGPRYASSTPRLREILKEVSVEPDNVVLIDPTTPFNTSLISLLTDYYRVYGVTPDRSWTDDPLYSDEIDVGITDRYDPTVDRRVYEIFSQQVNHIVSVTDTQTTTLPESEEADWLEEYNITTQQFDY